ncbi:MAG: group 1 truncated hemoglobin [Candidatus Rokubacteria bacterium]|nr:group 1 truncated hemoglobin [Candidatus Rokubacteria bacterium]
MRQFATLVMVVAVGGLALVASPAYAQCSGANDGKGPTNFGACPSGASSLLLYERLRAVDGSGIGRQGRDAISIVVDQFVANMVADSRVNARFKGMPGAAVEKLKSNLSDQICQAAGGPCSYYGRDMKTTHKGLNITEAEWNATVENLVKAMDKSRVGDREQKDLLAAVGPMKGDIVGQ